MSQKKQAAAIMQAIVVNTGKWNKQCKSTKIAGLLLHIRYSKSTYINDIKSGPFGKFTTVIDRAIEEGLIFKKFSTVALTTKGRECVDMIINDIDEYLTFHGLDSVYTSYNVPETE